ncbi:MULTISPECIES: TcmI family type II polyketide cyclase [Streptomyces]|uniref:Polyketide synthase n=1 Tax=Streptomyces naganishii JCM 4654 TaxID=1306179 RepID=A0A918Y839_9ACTN|nr:TcmI family type II polyketide cyclase [Streptomyces naganishii]GHD93792.1 polyketide synthase [Streptomyces naganishii JCM 4654]
MHRTLIVAKLRPDRTDEIAKIFDESDATELPHMIGVSRRTLFKFHGLYFHLVEADEDIGANLYRARSHPLYDDINTRLAQCVEPYDPDWKEPRDAMAEPFYIWTKDEGRIQ